MCIRDSQSGVPLVSTCHSWYDTDRIVRLYGALDRFVLRRYPRVVAVSDEVRRRLLKAGVREQRIRMVRNGIDLRQFAAAEPSLRAEFGAAPIVGLVGRLAWEKGVDLFLRAAAKLLPQFPQARFVVAGEGPDREKLQQLIADLAIGESVAMLGRRDDMAGVYASLDVMVSASRQEGLPIAVLEAMASARAVVATAVGDVPSISYTHLDVYKRQGDAHRAGLRGIAALVVGVGLGKWGQLRQGAPAPPRRGVRNAAAQDMEAAHQRERRRQPRRRRHQRNRRTRALGDRAPQHRAQRHACLLYTSRCV